jgi:hypothetical protein
MSDKTRLVRESVALVHSPRGLREDYGGRPWLATRWPDDPECPIKAEDALRTFLNGMVLLSAPVKYNGAWWVYVIDQNGCPSEEMVADLIPIPEEDLTLLPSEPERPERRTEQRRKGDRRLLGKRRGRQPSVYHMNDRRASVGRRTLQSDRRTTGRRSDD